MMPPRWDSSFANANQETEIGLVCVFPEEANGGTVTPYIRMGRREEKGVVCCPLVLQRASLVAAPAMC